MPAPDSDDLRQKVIKAIAPGERKRHVSKVFNVSRNKIDLGLKRGEATGSASASRDYQPPSQSED